MTCEPRPAALLLFFLALVVAPTAVASAQDRSGELMDPLLPVRLEAHGAITWEGTVGAGFRTEIPIVKQGVLFNAHDELSISLGSDFIVLALQGSRPLDIWPTATVQWAVGVNERFVFYPELGVAALVDRDGWQGVFPNVGFGGRYYIWRSVSAMARFGWPMALSIGATF